MKIKLTLKTPLKPPIKEIKLQQLRRFLQKKTGFHRGLALNFGGFLKTLFGIFRLFNVKSR